MIEQHNSLSEKFLKKGFWLYIFSFILWPIWYVIKIIISGDISISELWILYWVLSLVILLSSFNDFWMTESLNFFIPKYLEKNKYCKIKSIISYALITQILTWILIAIFLFFWAEYLSMNYFDSKNAESILKIFAIYFLWINVFQVFNNFFMVVQNTFYNKITEFLRMVFILIFTIWIYFFDLWNITTYAISWVLGLYVWIIFVIYFFYTKYYKKYFSTEKIIWSKKLFKEIFSYAILVFIWAQAATILWQMDMQMIIYLLNTEQAWYYTNYLSIITIPFLIIWPILGLLFPLFAEMHAKNQKDKIKLVKQIFQKNFIAIAIAFNILFFIFAEEIAYILFWEKYIFSWEILKYSILFLVFNFLLQINFNILAWIWKIKDRVKIITIALIFNFILNYILIKNIWVQWAALATWIWWILIYVLSEFFLWRDYFTHLNYKFLTKNIIIMWFFWIFYYYLINPLFESLTRINSLLLLLLFSIIWFIFFWIINLKEFKNFILEIKKLRKK